ncbi:MAG: transposase [Candidatus Koribacter versatilis]|uniref:Transposase n=1 Tax=Candidatus Korobacter versatilis TaxID=658062 RepID=A0A932EPA4_9BACT|nr:transposase [Candidatus Koribacter versatilis]
MESGTHFVTFRLGDSLPQSALAKLEHEAGRIAGDDKDEKKKALLRQIEKYLDRGIGACHLSKLEITEMVAAAIHRLDGRMYRLIAWVVMPNHVPLVVRVLPGEKLSSVLHSLKSFTAKEANRILKRRGSFWQREYYDHLVRTPDGFQKAVNYVLNNPLKAGLKDWNWVGSCGPEAHSTAGGDAGATL